jgi:Tfp pilus assembly protein PilF
MDFDIVWILLGLPLAFMLGWLASRFDLRQLRVENRRAPKAYFKGLNFLLNEQQDQAIDAFIEAVQSDPDTSELHFALGNLFRRRGEYDRAVRVHEHLLSRGDLPPADRVRAQHALALDFLKAGLLDRAEDALRKLENTPFETQARLALLAIYERSREWPQAAEVAHKLEASGEASFAGRLAHYLCEQAAALTTAGDHEGATRLLRQAIGDAPQSARPRIQLAALQRSLGQHDAALKTLQDLDRRPCRRHAAGRGVAGGDCAGLQSGGSRAGPAANQLRAGARAGHDGSDRPSGSGQQWRRPRGLHPPSGARALADRGGPLDRRRKAGARPVPSVGPACAGPCCQAPEPLPLCRLWLRGQGSFLAVPRLPGLGQLPPAAGRRTLRP